uniref:UBA domain-containing protein n=1 Tax=Plectus sambesii TaxID=2011161 RepID=A0A914X4T8_9BILA
FGIPEMSRPHSIRTVSESSMTVSDMSAVEEPPAWLEAMMEKMRGELKTELMETLSGRQSSSSSVRRGSASRSDRDSAALPHDCDLCCQPIADVRYFCLNKCGSVLCPTCVNSVGHDEDHVLLRVTPNYRGKPKRLLTQAELVLRGLRAVSTSSALGTHSAGLPTLRALAHDVSMLAKKEKETPEAVVAGVVPETLRNIVDTIAARSEVSEEFKNTDFDASIEQESKTGLMNDLGGGVGAYWKKWTIRNIGTANWREVKLHSIDVGCDKLQPFAPAAVIPALEPGQSADVMVWMYGPVSQAGVYNAYWRLRSPQGADFGPQLLFDFTIADHSVTEEARATPEDDEYSIVGTADDPDFELVSDGASTISFSPSVDQSGRSTPADHEDIFENHSEQIVEQIKDDEEELSTAATSLVNSLEFACANETASPPDASTATDSTIACTYDSPLLDQSVIVETPLPRADAVGASETVTSPPVGEEASAHVGTVPDAQPAFPSEQSPYRIPPSKRDVSMNGVLVGAVKVATKVADKARDAAEKAVGKAQQQWTASTLPRWQPSGTAWTPRSTQTDWSAPDDWTAPQPWRAPSEQDTEPPTTETPTYDPHKMEALIDMGFADVDRNIQFLNHLNGDLGAVIDALLQNAPYNAA